MGLADVHLVLGFHGFEDFGAATLLSTELKAEALRLAPDVLEIRVSVAVELRHWKDDCTTAGAECRRAADVGALQADDHRLYGTDLEMAGQCDAALDEMRAGIARDPAAPAVHMAMGDVCMAIG